MSKLIDILGLREFGNNVKAWVNQYFLRKEDAPSGTTPSSTTPKMDGTASVGSETAFARGDHRHPSDASKQDVIADLSDIRSGAALGATALQSYTETDPTVPSWAKAESKPTYTASEVGAIASTEKGANSGVASLDSSGKVPSSQLPSYVDDVQEYTSLAQFPAIGESGKIYVAINTNKTYRWSGSLYVEIAQGLTLGETSSTAFAGDRGKAIEDKIPSTASTSNKLATTSDIPSVPVISTDISADATSDTKTASPKAVKTYVDNHSSGGTATDVQVNGTSITSSNVANIVTESAYNASSNKIATMSDLPSVPVTDVTVGGTSVVSSGTAVVPAIPTVPTISTDIASDATSDTKTTSPKAVKTFVENKGYGTYSKPSGGIPKTDLESTVQTSLGKADTALQSYTETDPVFLASAAYGISSSDITNWNGKTSNTGTITSVKMNGSTVSSSGEADLGTVITSHQDISGKANKSEMSVVAGTGTDSDKTTITLKTGTSATVLTSHQSLSGKQDTLTFEGTYNASTNKAATMSAVIPSTTEIKNIVYITETDYGNLSTKVATTLYVIPESNA